MYTSGLTFLVVSRIEVIPLNKSLVEIISEKNQVGVETLRTLDRRVSLQHDNFRLHTEQLSHNKLEEVSWEVFRPCLV